MNSVIKKAGTLEAERRMNDKMIEVLGRINEKFCSRPYGTGSYIPKPLRDDVACVLSEALTLKAQR